MTKKYKVTKQILAEACDKAYPFTKHCPIMRAIQVEYPDAEGTYEISLNSDFTLRAEVGSKVIDYMNTFDRLAKLVDGDDGKVTDIEARRAIMNLPEFEFEINILN